MKLEFANQLQAYNNVAAEEVAITENNPNKPAGYDALRHMELSCKAIQLRKSFNRERKTGIENQEEIYEIQLEKQMVMQNLHHALQSLDHPEETAPEQPKDSIMVKFEEGQYIIQDDKGGKHHITRGEIITDAEWGVEYYLDPKTVPRLERKFFLIEAARQKLHQLLDEQIYLDQTTSMYTSDNLKEAFTGWMEDKDGETEKMGHIIEKMVRLYMKKICTDNKIDFDIHYADAFQDVVQKIDFIVHRTGKYGGVDIQPNTTSTADQTSPSIKDEGIQFTVSTSEYTLSHKKHQISSSMEYIAQEKKKPVENIVLVALPRDLSSELYSAYTKWDADPTTGGPDQHWSQEVKFNIFKAVLQDMFNEDEIIQRWNICLLGLNQNG